MDFILHSTLTSALERLQKHYRCKMREGSGVNASTYTRVFAFQFGGFCANLFIPGVTLLDAGPLDLSPLK